MKKLVLVGVFVLSCLAGVAETYHWTGAEDGFWTNRNNWSEGTVPGRYLVPADGYAATNGAPEGVAIFGDDLTGKAVTTIDMDGVYSISNLTTTGTHRYTYGTKEDQYIPLEPWGTLSVAETSATPVPVVVCRIRCGVECMHGYYDANGNWKSYWGQETITFRNNSTEEFVLDRWGWQTVSPLKGGSGGQTGIRFEGTGDVRIDGTTEQGGQSVPMFYLALRGKMTVNVPLKLRCLTFENPAGGSSELQLEITANGRIKPGASKNNYLSCNRDVHIFGEGAYQFSVAYNNGWGCAQTFNSKKMRFDCPVELDNYSPEKGDPLEQGWPYSMVWDTSGGEMTFNGTSNTLKGVIALGGSGTAKPTLSAVHFGLRGTVGAHGDCDFLLCNSATVKYVGSDAETTDRGIEITNRTAAVGAIEQAGTGSFTVTSAIVKSANASTATLELKGDNVTPATFAGTLAEGVNVKKSGTGCWIFSPASFGDTCGVDLAGGELRIADDIKLSSLSTSAGTTCVRIADGADVILDAVSCKSGTFVNFVYDSGKTTVKVASGSLPATGVQFNGHPVTLDGNGYLQINPGDNVMWKKAVDGDWMTAANWFNGLPGMDHPTLIDAYGSDYAVTLSENVQVGSLTLQNESGGTATLLVTNDATLTISGETANGAILNVKPHGRLEIAEAEVRLEDRGKSSSATGISYNSPLGLSGGEVVVKGTGALRTITIPSTMRTDGGNVNSYFRFGTGTVRFEDDSSFECVAGEGDASKMAVYLYLQGAAGATSRVTFADRSRMNMLKTPHRFNMVPNRGHTILEFDSENSKLSGLWNGLSVGAESSGLSELIIRRGTVATSTYDKHFIATPGADYDANLWTSAMFTTGRVVIAEGAQLSTYCREPATKSFGGVVFGHGTTLNKARGESYLYGEMEVAGTYTQERGVFLLGAGPCAAGEVRQTGGSVTPGTSVQTDSRYMIEVAFGVFGGDGRYLMSDGVFKTVGGVYVGGATTNDLNHWHMNGDFLQQYHDAKGLLRVAGGTFEAVQDVVVGCDGTGAIELSGTGVIKAPTVTISNTVGQAASSLAFRADANGRFGAFDAATKLVFAEGSQLLVDAVTYPKGRLLLAQDEPVEGFDYIREHTVLVNGAEDAELVWSDDGKSLRYRVPRGTMLLLR